MSNSDNYYPTPADKYQKVTPAELKSDDDLALDEVSSLSCLRLLSYWRERANGRSAPPRLSELDPGGMINFLESTIILFRDESTSDYQFGFSGTNACALLKTDPTGELLSDLSDKAPATWHICARLIRKLTAEMQPIARHLEIATLFDDASDAHEVDTLELVGVHFANRKSKAAAVVLAVGRPDQQKSESALAMTQKMAFAESVGQAKEIYPKHMQLIQECFPHLVLNFRYIGDLFLQYLLEIDPSIRKKFKSNVERQGRIMGSTMASLIRSLSDPESARERIRQISHYHRRANLTIDDYRNGEAALMKALEHVLEDKFTRPMKEAWRQTYRHMVRQALTDENSGSASIRA